jgi:cell division protein FtsB
MGPKYKVTGCARFFVFAILFVPAVFFGAAYVRGENGVQIIKDFYHSIVGGGSGNNGAERQQGGTAEEDKDKEIVRLKQEIEEKDKEIEKLKSGGQ